jgi:hypothetical protein
VDAIRRARLGAGLSRQVILVWSNRRMSVQDDSLCCLPSHCHVSARARERDAEPSAGGSQDSGRHYKVMRSCDIDHTHTLFKETPLSEPAAARRMPCRGCPCAARRADRRAHDTPQRTGHDTRQSTYRITGTSRHPHDRTHPHDTPAARRDGPHDTVSAPRSCVQPRACRLLQGPGGDTRS